MRKTLIPTALALVALMAPALAHDFKPVRSENSFRNNVVGKTMVSSRGMQVSHADGKVTGQDWKRGKFTGAWKWEEGFYCLSLVYRGKQSPTECMQVEVHSNQLRLTLEKGTGAVIIASLE